MSSNLDGSVVRSNLIIGASRGIGLEFTAQLLALGQNVIATARNISSPGLLDLQSRSQQEKKGCLTIVECDVSDENSIRNLAEFVGDLVKGGRLIGRSIENVIVNAGILEYPNRVLGGSFANFQKHLTTNAVGPLMCASALLSLTNEPLLKISNLIFISSDSGSATHFRGFEDGFAAYGASKAALNMGLRHLASELKYTAHPFPPTVLALHPGEVDTDMARSASLAWGVDGSISVQESVGMCLQVIEEHGRGGKKEAERGIAEYLTWDGRTYEW